MISLTYFYSFLVFHRPDAAVVDVATPRPGGDDPIRRPGKEENAVKENDR